jgi:hypothetical protein
MRQAGHRSVVMALVQSGIGGGLGEGGLSQHSCGLGYNHTSSASCVGGGRDGLPRRARHVSIH